MTGLIFHGSNITQTCVYTKAPTTSIHSTEFLFSISKKIVVTHKFFNLFHKSTNIHFGLKTGTTF